MNLLTRSVLCSLFASMVVVFSAGVALGQNLPTLTVSTTSVNLNYTLQSEMPPSQTVTVTSTAPVEVGVSAVNPGSPVFLAVLPVGDQPTPATFTVYAFSAVSSASVPRLDQLAPGKYPASFQLIGVGASNSPTVNVTLTVTAAAAPAPTITVSPNAVNLVAPVCPAAPAAAARALVPHQNIMSISCPSPSENVHISASITMNSSASIEVEAMTTLNLGLTVDPTSTTVYPGVTSTFTVTLNPNGQPEGNQIGMLFLTQPNNSVPFAMVPVKITVTPDTIVQLNPTSLNSPGGAQTFTLDLIGKTGGVTSFTVSEPSSSACQGVQFEPAAGVFDGNGRADIILYNASQGSATFMSECAPTIDFTNADGSSVVGSPLTIPLAPAATTLDFLGAALAFNSNNTDLDEPVEVVDSNGNDVDFSTSAPNGLTVTPSTGKTPASIQIGQSTDVASIFAPGTYLLPITVASSEGATATESVTLTVGASQISSSPNFLTFNIPEDSTSAVSQTVRVKSGGAITPVTVTTSTLDGNKWLTFPGNGYTTYLPATGDLGVTVAVNPQAFPADANTLYGDLTLQSGNPTTGTTTFNVPVQVNVMPADSPASAIVSPTVINAENGDFIKNLYLTLLCPRVCRSASVDLPGATVNPQTFTPGSGPTTAIAISLPQNQSPGTYLFSVKVTDEQGNTVAAVPAISVQEALRLSARESDGHEAMGAALYYYTEAGFTNHARASAASTVPSETINLTGSGGSSLSYVAIAPDWLTVSPASGTTPQALTVAGNPAVLSMLGPGSYVGEITIAAASAPNPLNIPVNLVIGTAPSAAAVNAASGQSGAVSPGEIISIYGTEIGPATPAGLTLTSTGTVSTTLGNTQVLFDGVAAPLTYAGSGQINAIVPYEVGGEQFTSVTIQSNGTSTGATVLSVTDSNPAIFSQDGSGSGLGAILNQDSTVNGLSNPAAVGSVVTIFATGEGPLAPSVATGSVTSSTGPTFPAPVGPVSVTIAGNPAKIEYAGEAPGFASGVFQLDVTIPAGTASGAQPVVVTVGNNSNASQNITVAVE